MAQPTPYTRQYDFSDYQDDFPDAPLPGNQVDIEFNAVRTSLNQTIENLGLIQADDGDLRNAIVSPETLDSDTLALLVNGLSFRGVWTTTTMYEVGDVIRASNGATYIALVAHTSGTFATDLAANKWFLFANPVGALGDIVFEKHDGDGSTETFSLPIAVVDEKQLFVFVGGAIQDPESAYTVTGSTIEFATAPPSGTGNILIFGVDQTAVASANEAATSASAAATSATNAATSATNASNSATAASGSASTASTAATNASNSATAAATSATNASNSASAAATSETNAATSATAAQTAEANAETAETNAETAETNAETAATAAAASQTAAATSATNAATSATNAGNSATAAAASASAASTSETNAASSASSAAASASAAAATLAHALWRDVTRLTSASSPYTVSSADNGKLIVCDTTGGAITVNLPQISGLTLPFNLGIQLDAGANNVTINRGGTDTIDGSTSASIANAGAGIELIADDSASPDEWEAMLFGQSGGNMTPDLFSGTGAQTAFTLSVDPGTENNTWVFISGVYQQKNTYSVSGTTLTFSVAPPSGTDNIQVMIGSTLAIGVPSDDTVSTAKLQNNAVQTAKIADSQITFAKLASSAVASQAEAEAGSATNKLMTPERTAQAIAALAAGGASLGYETTAAAITLDAANNGQIVELTGATSRTWSFTAAATLGADWWCYLVNNSTAEITLDPNGAELIDGLATYKMYPGEVRLVRCTGTAFHTVVVKSFYVAVTQAQSPFVFTKPPGYTAFGYRLGGAGGSGGKCRNAASAGGGGGGACVEGALLASVMGTTETITVGTGGASQTVADSDGNVGGNTTFNLLATAYGGGPGGGGVSGEGGGGGGGALAAGAAGASGAGGNGGGPLGGLGSTSTSVAGADSTLGGAGGGINGSAAQILNGGSSFNGGGGGGGGSSGSGANGFGGNSVNGGAGGGGAGNSTAAGAGGTSIRGGQGGNGAIDANNAVAGSAGTNGYAGGGGGGAESGNSGAGGNGSAAVWGIA